MTNTPKDGGPAFPTQDYDRCAAQAGFAVTVTDQPGMSLRDWFAGQALAGIAAAALPDAISDLHQGLKAGRREAAAAYAWADAMIAERAE